MGKALKVLVLLAISLAALVMLAPARSQDKPAAPGAAAPAAGAPQKVYGQWFIRVKPDKGPEYDRLIGEKGLPLFREAGGRMVGWWKTGVGDLYEQVTLWEYDGLPAYERAVGKLVADDRFKAFVEARDPLLAGERSSFLALGPGGEAPVLPEPAKVIVHEVHRVALDKVDTFLRFFGGQVPVLKKQGFRPAGPFRTLVGRRSEVLVLWKYESLEERDRLVTSFNGQEIGRHYHQQVAELAEETVSRILMPAPFARSTPQ